MRIACVLGHDFEDDELCHPYEAFRRAGYEVLIIGAQVHEAIEGLYGKVVRPHLGINDARAEYYDALFIPGGHSPENIRLHDGFVEFTRGFHHKPIFAIGRGPQLLLTADMVRGRTMTAWKTVRGDLRHAGANVVDQEVCVDRNIVTSRKTEDIPAFVRASLEMLARREAPREPISARL